jgi:hypothetical protein
LGSEVGTDRKFKLEGKSEIWSEKSGFEGGGSAEGEGRESRVPNTNKPLSDYRRMIVRDLTESVF